MNIVEALTKIKKTLSQALELAVILLLTVLVLDVIWGVISRYVGRLAVVLAERGWQVWSFIPRGQSQWTEEVATNLLVWVSLLGASVAFGTRSHLGVDYFVEKFDEPARRLIELIVQIIIGFFAISAMIIGGGILVWQTLKTGQTLPAMKILKGYMYLSVPISGAFILLFAAERIVEVLSGKPLEKSTESID